MEPENAYYTPEESELTIGLEYQYKTHDGVVHSKEELDSKPWQDGVISSALDIPYVWRSLKGKNAEHSQTVRVKKLDREDVEALGWSYVISPASGISYYNTQILEDSRKSNGKLQLVHNMVSRWVNISMDYGTRQITMYGGYCRNKGHLQQLMKDLEICQITT